MRLTEYQRTAIVEAIREYFGRQVRVMLFGSRVDDTVRGGDIDLLVETDEMAADSERAVWAKLKAISEIQRRIGDRKIDLVVSSGKSTSEVVRQARSTGVAL
jgi:uncharacterized protein